jgi:TPR repeat protein
LHEYFNYFGIGTNGNKEEAFNLFNKASERGHILAQYYVGLCYESGSGTVKNERLSFECFKKIAEADESHALGQFKIGYFYYKGIGVKKNLKEAFRWYEKAALRGNSAAMYNLGMMYKKGEGTDKDIDKAFIWCNKSVEQGNQDAQKNLEKWSIRSKRKTHPLIIKMHNSLKKWHIM